MEDNWSELSRAQWELLKRPITLFHSKLQRDNSANVHINKCEGKIITFDIKHGSEMNIYGLLWDKDAIVSIFRLC